MIGSGLTVFATNGRSVLLALELHILEGRGVEVPVDEPEAGLRHARALATQERRFENRGEHHALVHELLDLVEDGLAALRVQLACLFPVEAVDVRVAAVRSDPPGNDEGLDARRRIARRRAATA